MINEQLIKLCARIRIVDGDNTVNNGSGTILNIDLKHYVLTAYHCIYGDNNEFSHLPIECIVVETQDEWNKPFRPFKVTKIVSSSPHQDWILLEIEIENREYPTVLHLDGFKIDTAVAFRGVQYVNQEESRIFKCIVKDIPSEGEFKITLAPGEKFKDDADDAKGLSGSGVFVLNGNKLHLIGLLKSVKGTRAINDDIRCCSIDVLKTIFPDSFIELVLEDFDCTAAKAFEEVGISDNRNMIDKIRSVCADMSDIRISKYCMDMALGKEELTRYDERAVSAMKFRIFHACQDELIDFTEEREMNSLTIGEIKQLIKIFTDKAEEIIQTKSATYSYPITDRDILNKIVLGLINDCYLSFDKEGIYGY